MKINILAFSLALVAAPSLFAGRILLSSLDADYHASFEDCGPACLNPIGAQAFISTAVSWVRAGSSKPFLYVESNIVPPFAAYAPGGDVDGFKAFHATGEIGIQKSGYVAGTDYEKHDASTLENELKSLDKYSAIVVASDFGGILTAAELSLLNLYAGSIADFVAIGGGLYAMVESNDGIGLFDPVTGLGDDENFTDSTHSMLKCCRGLLGNETRYGFVPVSIGSQSSHGSFDADSAVTAFGAGLGFNNEMVRGNVSHLIFQPGPEWNIVSYDTDGNVANIAMDYTGTVTDSAPEPASLMLTAAGLAMLAFSVRRRRSSP